MPDEETEYTKAPWWYRQLRAFWFPASLLLSLLGVYAVIQLARMLEISRFGAISFLAIVALQVVIWRAGVWAFDITPMVEFREVEDA